MIAIITPAAEWIASRTGQNPAIQPAAIGLACNERFGRHSDTGAVARRVIAAALKDGAVLDTLDVMLLVHRCKERLAA